LTDTGLQQILIASHRTPFEEGDEGIEVPDLGNGILAERAIGAGRHSVSKAMTFVISLLSDFLPAIFPTRHQGEHRLISAKAKRKPKLGSR
jgi:hypothetical protein